MMEAMFGAIAGFVIGAFTQVAKIMLVFVGPLLGAKMIGIGPTLALLIPFAFFAAYSAFSIVPSRELVQGWLGMVAGRQPASYDGRAKCLGRGLACLSTLLSFLVPLADNRQTPEQQAMVSGFLVLTIAVYGVLGAVPWLWFGVLGKPRDELPPDDLPDLLREAGKRGSRFCYCAFLAIGLGIIVAEGDLDGRTGTWDERAGLVVPSGPYPLTDPVLHRDEIGKLCATPTPDCPREHRSELTFAEVGKLKVNVGTWSRDDRCSFRFDPGFPMTPGAWPTIHAFLVDPQPFRWRAPKVTVLAGDRVGVTATVPSGATSCEYKIYINELQVAP
jgi:hypothetical protein